MFSQIKENTIKLNKFHSRKKLLLGKIAKKIGDKGHEGAFHILFMELLNYSIMRLEMSLLGGLLFSGTIWQLKSP